MKDRCYRSYFMGVVMYVVFTILHNYSDVGVQFKIISIFGILIAFISYFRIRKYSAFSQGPNKLFFFFLCINFISIVIGFFSPTVPVSALLTQPTYILSYTFPLLFLLNDLKKLFTYTFACAGIVLIFEIIFCVLFRDRLYFNAVENYLSIQEFDGKVIGLAQTPIGLFSTFAPFLFLWSYFGNKCRIVIVIAFILGELAALMIGRRSAAIMPLFYILLSILFQIKNKHLIKYFLMIFIVALFISPYVINFFVESGTFDILLNRLDSDTRSFVEEQFYKDMNTFDWIFGRGMCGTYTDLSGGPDPNVHRANIETGYLNYILHGGLLLFVPYAFMILQSAYNNIFKSSNIISKMCGAILLVEIINFYIGGVYGFLSLTSILVVISVKVGYNTNFRYLDDDTLVNNLFENTKIWKLIKK